MPMQLERHQSMPLTSPFKRHDARPTAHARGYGRRWQRLARMVLHRQPLCTDPFGVHAAEGWCAPAECVDHIVPLRRGGSNLTSNLQALCGSCHARKTVRCDGGFGRPRRNAATPWETESIPPTPGGDAGRKATVFAPETMTAPSREISRVLRRGGIGEAPHGR